VTVWIYPPHLINVATLPCESQNTKNVILQWDITKDNCIRCNIASSKWTRVIMCLKFTYVGCYTAKRAWNKDSWHRRPAKTLNANLLPAALRAAQACRYLIYSEADFEVFCPAWATRCTDGVKLGMEEVTEGPVLHAKFHLHQCNDGCRPQKLKFLLRFDRHVEYKRPAGA